MNVCLFLCRGDQTRTGDPFVPNEVRYQLRYTPIVLCKITAFFLKMQEKTKKLMKKFGGIKKKSYLCTRNQGKCTLSGVV